MPSLASHPVRRPPQPCYPTRLDVRNDPDLLARHLPPSWLGRGELAGALGLMLALNSSGCTSDTPRRPTPQATLARTPAVVAPVFQHGDGHTGERGMLGCVAVSAPVFLSEEEAIAVIREELQKAGVHSILTNAEIPTLVIDGSVEEHFHDSSAPNGLRTRNVSAPLQVDLRDPVRNINIEFVSENDFGPLGGDWNGKYYDDVQQAATSLCNQVKGKAHDMRFVAFYDPIEYRKPIPYPDFEIGPNNEVKVKGEDYEQKRKNAVDKATAESKRLLRLQVQDFVNWLKAQGAI